jgi:hypothetical protein
MQNINDMSPEELMQLEIEKAMRANNNMGDPDLENEKALFEKLRAPFSKDAYSQDTSRGFALTSLKAQYVVERLNEVLGFMNWSHGGEYELQEDGSVLFKGALVVNLDGRTNRFFGVGYAAKKKNIGDAYKGAKTDSLSKCASQIGVGNDAFKGLVDPNTFELKTTGSAGTATTTQAKAAAKSVSTPAAPKKFARKSTKQVSSKTTTKGKSL